MEYCVTTILLEQLLTSKLNKRRLPDNVVFLLKKYNNAIKPNIDIKYYPLINKIIITYDSELSKKEHILSNHLYILLMNNGFKVVRKNGF